MSFGDVMAKAAQLCAGDVQVVLANRTLAADAVTLERHSATYRPFNRHPMRDLLNQDAEPFHYLFGVESGTKFNPATMALQFDLATDISFANTLISGMTPKDGQTPRFTAGQVLPDLRARLDNILLRAALLGESFRHMEGLHHKPDIAAMIPRVAGNPVRKDPARVTVLEAQLAPMIGAYRSRCGQAIAFALRHAFDPDRLQQMAARHVYCDRPIWMTYGRKEIGRFFNDVWFPDEYAQAQLKRLALAQGQAMMQRPKNPGAAPPP